MPAASRDPDRSDLDREHARIGAEILGADGGTDPFVAAVRATRMPMIVTDPRQHDNPVVFANDAFCRLTGYERSEILGRNCRFLQGPETDPDTVRRLHDAVVNAVSVEVDIRNHRKDGEPFWNRLLLAPVRDAAGEVAYFFASQVDVTLERERLEGLQLQNAALIAELNDRLRSQQASEARLRFAMHRAEVLLELDRNFGALDDPSAIAFAAAEALGRTLDVSRAGYGSIDTAQEIITIERDWNAPGVESLAGVLNFRDYGSYIDDLKRGDTVVVADARHDTRTAGTADALAAISALSFINMPVTEAGESVALLYLNHAQARPWKAEELSFVREVAARTRQAVERRRAEQKLQAFANTLEAQVSERTEALMAAEGALRQSQKMEAVGQLTGGLAHDFNNLLAAISGSLEMLDRRRHAGKADEMGRFIGIAQSASKKAAALTHRLLAFSRQQALEPKPLSMNQLVSGMEELIRRTIGPAISLEVVSAVGLWIVSADPGQLENSLLNLCINARDAMPDGGKLTIETGNRWIDERVGKLRDLPPGQYVSMCVSDNGTGMSPDVIARAFDPFFTTKPIGMGTGLGLSMVYGFAQQSGGQVRIYSELGQGTMVCIYLPRHDGAEAPVEVSAEPKPESAAAAGQTVLVVDDEPMVRLLIVELLQELGYAVVQAADGAEALAVLRSQQRIDLLVTDVGLPGGMNGRQVADAARVSRPGMKTLFITGYAENAVLSHGHLDPGMHVMTKPFDFDTLARRVKELVDN